MKSKTANVFQIVIHNTEKISQVVLKITLRENVNHGCHKKEWFAKWMEDTNPKQRQFVRRHMLDKT